MKSIVLFFKKLFRNKYFIFSALGILIFMSCFNLYFNIVKIFKYGLITGLKNHWLYINFFFLIYFSYLFIDTYAKEYGLKAKADEAYKNGDYKTAIELYSKLLKIFRYNGHYYADRGNCYYKLRQWHQAITDYSRAIELNPDSAYIYENRGNAYKFLGFHSHAKIDLAKFKQLKNAK